MALSDLSKTWISVKKLSGKAHTSNEKELYNEELPSGVTLSSETIFGQQPPPGIDNPYPFKITNNIVEFLRLPVTFIDGTDTASGQHGFEVKLPSDYETESDNPNAGTYPFLNNQIINITSGSLQLIPPSFAPNYEAKPYYGTLGSGSQIPVADARDWNLDYFNGILFQQDPPGTGDHAENPDYIEAYLYIGNYLSEVVSQTGDITGVTAGSGMSGGGSSGAVTLGLDLDSLSAIDVDVANDSIAIIDATDNSTKKESIADIVTGIAGSGLAANGGVLSVDIDELDALGGTGIDQTDNLMFSDGGTEKKITFSNLEDAIFGNISGDATVAAGGALTIANDAVEASMLNDNVISGQDEMTGDVEDTDEILISDAGTVKRADFSVLRDAVFNDVSGDATIAAGGALTIAANAVEGSMLNSNTAGNGISYASNALNLDLNELTDGDMDLANDSIAIIDATDNTTKKETIANILSGSAGAGLSATSGVLAVSVDDTGIEIDSDTLRLKDSGVTNAKLQNSGITFARVGGNSTVASLGGTVSFQGSAGEVTVGENSGVFTIGLPDNVAIATGLTVNGVEATTNTATQTLTNKTLTSPVLNGTISGTSIKDEDDFASNSATHLATQQSIKAYVDSQIAGLDVKASVTVATTASFTMASTASTSTLVLADGEGGFDATADTLTIDGVSLSAGDRVLIKDGVNSNSEGVDNKWNGVYTVGALNGTTLTLTRAEDFNSSSDFTGAPFFMVESGSDNGAHGFVSNLTSNPTIGTDPITFFQFSAPGQDAVAGAGLSMTGNVLSVDIDELSALGGTGLHQTQDHFIFSDNGTEKKITFSNLEDAIFGNVSGQATIAAGGAISLDISAITSQTNMTGDVDDDDELMINDGGTLKRIDFSVLRDAIFNDVSGDASIATGGALTIGADTIEDSMIHDNVATALAGSGLSASSGVLSIDIDELSALGGAGLHQTQDHFIFSDNGVEKKITFSNLEDAIFANISGDATVAAGGALTIGANAIEDSMVNDNVAAGLAGAGLTATNGVIDVVNATNGGLFVDSNNISLFLNDLASADVDVANDSIAIIDATDNSSKKESIADIMTAAAGDGLDATSGVLSLDLQSGGGLKIESTELVVDDSKFAALTGSVFSGNVVAQSGLSGSLQSLSDGSAYLLAGSNVTITTGSNGQITIASSGAPIDYAGDDSVIKSATDGTSSGENITVADGDLVLVQDITDGNVKYVAASQLPGSGGSGTIGAAEDGDYTDGLFTDFTSSTAVGTPIDRFNEVLKLLVPTPAPSLDDIDANTDGVDVKLSFGTSNDQSSASPAYANVAASAGIAAAVDVNGDYETATSSNNLRIAVFDGTQDIIGDLNEDVTADITSPSNRTNYPANSFGDADAGSLILEVNGANVQTIDLTSNSIGTGSPGSGTGTHVDSDGSGFINLSIAANGTFDNGTTFPQFKHRTGRWKVAAASQRDGWNYARVKHNKGGSTVETNYVEWVNDSDSNALAASSNSIAFTGVGSTQLSGVTYNTSGTLRYQVTVSNAYRYVYDSTASTFSTSASGTTSGVSYSISSIAKAAIGGGENHLKQITVDETDNLTANYILGGSVSAGINVSHPLKSNLSNAGQSTASGILIYNVSDSATVTSEPFVSETYRLKSGDYNSQSDAASGNAWDSSQSLTAGSAGHTNGLQVYRERLYSPLNTLNSGDFRNTTDGGSLANGPDSNPNYSGISGTKYFYRKFQNTGSSVRDFSWTLAGDVTLVGHGDSLGSNDNIKIYFKMPSDGGSDSTGWLDAKSDFVFGTTTDNAGGAIGTVDTSDAMTNNVSFGTVSIDTNEYIVARIEADSNWDGYIDSLSVSFGAVGSVSTSPNVNNIDANNSGINAKLSFGDTLTKAGYSTVETTAGASEVNANGTYSLSGLRRGIFNGTAVVAGEINETTTADGNSYPANAFGGGKANQGTLKLEVNGSVVHSINLASFGSGSDLNSNSSGFTSVSAATPGEDGSNLPDFTKFYRTGAYQVGTADQRSGQNYARVIHTVDSTDHESTYVEWVNDDASRSIAIAGETIDTFAETGTPYYLSGVKYFVSPTAKFKYRIADVYKHVYSLDSDAIDYPTTTNSTITAIACAGEGIVDGSVSSSSRSMPALNTSVSAAYDKVLNVTGSFTFDQSSSLPGETAYTVTLRGRVNHPLAGDTSSASTTSAQWLVFTDTDNSTDLVENFRGEAKRLEARDYDSQSDVYASGAFVTPWDSEQSLNGDGSGDNAGHNNGLMIYNRKLVSPQRAGHTSQLGDFRGTVDNNSSNIIAPTGNPNYSSVSEGPRTYYRWFKNNAGSTKYNFSVSINGTGTIVTSGTTLNGNKLKVFFKLPTTSTSKSTGWMDLATAFANGQYADDDGLFTGSFDSSLNATNTGTFGVQGVPANEYVIIKIVAAKSWTGNVSSISFSWS